MAEISFLKIFMKFEFFVCAQEKGRYSWTRVEKGRGRQIESRAKLASILEYYKV